MSPTSSLPGSTLAPDSNDVVPDPIFADPRLARIYDPLDGDRSDLDAYLAMVDEFDARSVLDVGCGTGTFAVSLARRGIEVVAVDPAAASLDVARSKDGATAVRWIHGDVTALPALSVDLATMTGNVAQVFLGDDDLTAALQAIRRALRPGGRVVFEVRDPGRKAWTSWKRDESRRRTDVHGVGIVESWVDVLDVSLPFVTFRWTYCFEASGDELTSDSTLRFRTRAEIEHSVEAAGLELHDVRDAPDRPGLEWLFVCGSARD